MRNLVLSAAVAVFISFPAAAQDPMEILKKTVAAYRSITSFEIEQVERSDSQSANSKNQNERREHLWGSGPKFRQESGTSPQMLTIFDGEVLWQYNSQANEYTKRVMPAPPAGRTGAMQRVSRPYPIAQYEMLDQRVKSARILRQETLELDGGPASCFVIELEHAAMQMPDPPPPQRTKMLPLTYWIEMSRGLVLKSVRRNLSTAPDGTTYEHSQTTTVVKAILNQPVADSQFKFTPPEGAVQVERFSFAPKSAQVGKELPDFVLQTLDGQPVSSAMLRGNLVLMLFGQGARGPMMMDDTLPFAELLHRVYKGQGIAVLYIAPQLDAGFQKQGFTLPAAIDTNSALARQLGFYGTGVVLADRTGKIIYAFNGSSSATNRIIVEELRKAGLW